MYGIEPESCSRCVLCLGCVICDWFCSYAIDVWVKWVHVHCMYVCMCVTQRVAVGERCVMDGAYFVSYLTVVGCWHEGHFELLESLLVLMELGRCPLVTTAFH